jgi:putative ABC transport system substrate-binding protein
MPLHGPEADMKRRQFLGGLGSAAIAWPLAVRAQQPERLRTVSLLVAGTPDDPEYQARTGAFLQALAQLGWIDGRNLRIDIRWATTNADTLRKQAAELAALAPDVILSATGTTTTAPLLEATRTLPIIFVLLVDPVGAGFVSSLARPGGNATGFLMFEYGLSGKWLELLKQIAPGVRRIAVLRDPTIASGIGQFGAIQSAAPSLGFEASPFNVRDAAEIERDIIAFARSPNGGVIVTAAPRALLHRELIATLTAKHRLPAIYSHRSYTVAGGLISYGPDIIDQFRRAAGYVDRILKGENPADLPVQAPTKFELVINLKAAKALGLELPDALVARANEVIE